jgi:murein DD-endopeptidase MepM/ murein hydrolase activator NlpD
MSVFAPLAPRRDAVRTLSVLTIATALSALLLPASPAAAVVHVPRSGHKVWVWPLTPTPAVVHPFDAPPVPYGAGNRGVDVAGSVGQTVLAIGGGVVAYAGVLAGRGVVVVRHGALRSTYEPVSATVTAGDVVRVGQPVGVLAAIGSHCPPSACLHLGVLRGTQYVDPLTLLGDPPIRLKPRSGDPAALAAAPRSAAFDAAVAAAGYRWPAVR